MDGVVSPEHAVVWDDMEEVRIFFVFVQWLLGLGETLMQICLFMYSYSSSSGSSNKLEERDFPILPGMPRDVESKVSADERKMKIRGPPLSILSNNYFWKMGLGNRALQAK